LDDDRTADGLRTATTVVTISGAIAPTVGQVLKATSSTAATWQPPGGTWVQTINLNGSASPYIQITSVTYSAVGLFEFCGTDVVGVPSAITAICHIGGGTDMDIRIYDVTNAQTICEYIDITDATPVIIDLGTISNLPTSTAIWEVQLLATGGGGKARCSNINLLFT
jgi:hypothetical protein